MTTVTRLLLRAQRVQLLGRHSLIEDPAAEKLLASHSSSHGAIRTPFRVLPHLHSIFCYDKFQPHFLFALDLICTLSSILSSRLTPTSFLYISLTCVHTVALTLSLMQLYYICRNIIACSASACSVLFRIPNITLPVDGQQEAIFSSHVLQDFSSKISYFCFHVKGSFVVISPRE